MILKRILLEIVCENVNWTKLQYREVVEVLESLVK
jgi:hypothetical protein